LHAACQVYAASDFVNLSTISRPSDQPKPQPER